MKILNLKKIKLFLPWAALYLLLIGGATVWAFTMYDKHNEYKLPSGTIELSVSKTRYQLGETIEFTITNYFPVSIFVTNNCPQEPLNVYEWRNEKWVQLHDVAKEDSECYTEERNVEIPSEGTRSYNFSDWPNLFNRPGVYRITTEIDHYKDIPFQDFVVLEPAKIVEGRDEPLPASAHFATPPSTPDPKTNIYFEERKNEDQKGDEEREYKTEDDD